MSNITALSILSVVSGYGLLIVFALFSLRRGNRRANLYLGSFILLVSTSVILHAFLYAGVTEAYPHLHLLNASFGFLYGPLLYFHIGALTQPSGNWSRRDLLRPHCIPFAIFLIYQMPFFILPSHAKLEVMRRGYIHWPDDQVVYSLLQNLSIAAYLWFSVRLVLRFGRIKNESDMIHSTVYRWSMMILSYVALTILFAFAHVGTVGLFNNWIMLTICSGFFGLTAYFWFLFPEAFIAVLGPTLLTKYQKSGLKNEDALKFEKKLLLSMESERPYLDANLSLKDLSARVGVNEVYLSQIINERIGKSFFEFLNMYRVQYAVSKLETISSAETILDIAYGAGFNSKSTFYAAFKKETGMTPGEYVKQHRLKKRE